jgi:hypothetical protein
MQYVLPDNAIGLSLFPESVSRRHTAPILSTIVSYNARAVKIYNATTSQARSDDNT